MILHLDSDFKPVEGKEINFEKFTFYGGEPHIKIKDTLAGVQEVTVTTRLNSFNDIGFFLVAIDALRRMGISSIKAIVPYMPAARQDRVMVPGEPLTVKVVATLINSLQLQQVLVYDPHSEVTPALLDNCVAVSNHTFIEKVIKDINSSHLNLISPDGGALKKIYKVAQYLKDFPVVECSKSRDVKTGKLSGFTAYIDDLHGADCLIVDDICDGGGTFLGLADELKAKNAGNLYLAVSHGIFSKGFAQLSEKFTKVYTTNSFKDFPEESLVVQFKLSDGLL